MISFIIPTYNEEKAIAETIKTLKEQYTLTPYEVIVADDGSTDNTPAIAETLADQVVTGPKITIAANRNRGAAAAKYPFLVFMDTGVNVPNPNSFFETALKEFNKDPNLAGMGPRVHIKAEVRTKTDAFFTAFMDKWFTIANNFLGWGLATGKFQIIRAEAFKKLGGFNESLAAGEDNDLFTRLSKLGKTKFAANLTVYHLGRREHAMGWPKLMFIWAINGLSVLLFKRSVNKEWKVIR